MKTRIICLVAALCFCATALQAGNGIPMGNLTKDEQHAFIFAFPGCTPGTVYKRDGNFISAKLNYDFYKCQALFWNDKPEFEDDTVRRLDLGDIFLIEIGDRSFVPALGGLGELILNNKVSLVQYRKVNILEKKIGAYGTSGSTSSVQNVSGITGANGTSPTSGTYSGQTSFINLRYDFESTSEISEEYTLFLMKDGKVTPLTKKSLAKMFPKAADFIKQYLEEQKPDLDDPQAMITLVNLANANNK